MLPPIIQPILDAQAFSEARLTHFDNPRRFSHVHSKGSDTNEALSGFSDTDWLRAHLLELAHILGSGELLNALLSGNYVVLQLRMLGDASLKVDTIVESLGDDAE